MGVIEILSSRREYTKLNPFVVLLGKGDHEITSSWPDRYGQDRQSTLGITCSNITFLGKGKDTTKILGGFAIVDFENITFKNMTVTNTGTRGCGILMRNAKVEIVDVALKGCNTHALFITRSTSRTTLVATRCEFANNYYGAVVNSRFSSAKFNNCVFHDNEEDGIYGSDYTIHLHGEATAIHSNGGYGILASNSAKMTIHLPSHHNTTYNNRHGDRFTRDGGTITNVED